MNSAEHGLALAADRPWPCESCGGPMSAQAVRLALWVDGQLLVLERVRAMVCGQCAEQAYDDATASALRRLMSGDRSGLVSLGDITVPVHEFVLPPAQEAGQ